jgi:hypothetical protein
MGYLPYTLIRALSILANAVLLVVYLAAIVEQGKRRARGTEAIQEPEQRPLHKKTQR